MGHISKWSQIMKNITLVGQLGLTLIVPILFCLFVCYYLVSHFGAGSWVYIPGFILGLGSSATTAWKFYMSRKGGKDSGKDTHTPSFNRHY